MAQETNKRLHVAVLGAGPSGLSTCRHLLANSDRFTFVCYEQRRGIGGTWLPADEYEVGREDLDEIESENNPKSLAGQRPFTVYKYLRTNLPAQHMSFPDFPFLPQHITEKQLTTEQVPWHFVAHYDVLNYFKSYAEHFQIMPHVRLNTQVDAIRLFEDDSTQNGPVIGIEQHSRKYVIKTHDTATNTPKSETFDAVIVCSGHYARPHWPTGIKNFNDFKGVLLHAKYYRSPEQIQLKNCKKILVLGGSVTGPDIILDIARQAPDRKLILAGHNEMMLTEESSSSLIFKDKIRTVKGTKVGHKPNIAEIVGPNSVKFIDGSIEEGIDALVSGTGFEYSFPMCEGEKDENPATLIELTNTGQRLQPLYRDMVHVDHAPTLCFVGLHHFGIGFIVMDFQSRYVVKLLRDEFKLPGRDEMLKKDEEDYQCRKSEYKWGQHYSHKLYLMAPKYHAEVVNESSIESLPDDVMPLFFSITDQILKNPESFRRLDYKSKTLKDLGKI